MSKSRDIADSAATINYIDNVTSDVQSQINTLDTALDNISVTSGTLTKTFASGESASINLTSSVLAPVVSVTKEVPQSGVTNNSWDVNSTTENYTRLDSAYATTLDWVGFDVSTASVDSSFSVASQETEPTGVAFNADGTKMFVCGKQGVDVNEYTLSTAYDVSTSTFVDSFSVSAQDSQPHDISFNSDGTKMFVLGYTNKYVNEYTLSTGFDISTATYSQQFLVSAQETEPRGMAFSPDGTKMFISGNSGRDVNEYTLSTSFDVSTASFVDSFSVSAQDTYPTGIAFNTSGTKMIIVGATGDAIYEYNLSTGFDVSTATYSQSISTLPNTAAPQGIAFNNNGTKMFVVADDVDLVFEYNLDLVALALGTGSFASADVGKTIEANSGVFVLTATDGSYVETTAPTSYDQVASGSWSMYGVVYNATDGDLELSSYLEGYKLSSASYDSVSFSIASQATSQEGLAFSTDGSKMYMLANDVYQYTLSTPFDLSTASYDSVVYVLGSETATPTGIVFKPDGTKMYVMDDNGNAVGEYSLSTAWNVSTASYTDNLSVGGADGSPKGFAFNSDGTKLYFLGDGSNAVYQYSLSTAYDVSSGTYDSVSFSVSSQAQIPKSVLFNSDGTKMYVLDTSTDSIYQYGLSTAFDLSTASYDSVSFSVASQDSQPVDIKFNADGSKIYLIGDANNSVYQYSTLLSYTPTGYHPVHTTASIDSTYWTDINSMTADQNAGDGNVYYAISTDDRTTWTVIDNTDGERDIVRNNAGTWQYNSNGTYALETWVNGTTNTELATLAEAMEGAVSSVGYQLSNASYDSVSFSVSSQLSLPTGIQFNNDGTKMYVVGRVSDAVFEYDLSTAYDISTASYNSVTVSVASQDTQPSGLFMKPDGTKMYVIGFTSDRAYQYTLSTAFDLSTASYDSVSLYVGSQSTDPYDICFSSDGTKMYTADTNTGTMYQYTLTTAWDLSTASYSSISFSTGITLPNGLCFNNDGTKLFISSVSSDDVSQFNLTTAFDISTASSAGVTFSVASQATSPEGIVFNSDGVTMFIIDSGNDSVYQYSTSTPTYTNQMDKTQLDAVTDPNHIALGNDLDLAIVFNMTSGTTVPSSDGVAINYDANVLNKGAVLGTDYDFDAPTQNSVRITALAANNLKVRVV